MKYLLSIAILITSIQVFAQTNKETTVRIISEKNYTFNATMALPLASAEISQVMRQFPGANGGGSINLTGSQYDVKITKDSVVAFLPFYGRAYNAPFNPNESGIKFTSKDFTYKESRTKKGNYTIQINTKDLKRENYQFTFNISQNGYASLMASSVNKQPINFNGYLEEPKKNKN